MRGWVSRIVFVGIVALTALSVVIVWPSEPDRYLPDAIPWPEGKGIELTLPTIEGGTFGLNTIERRAMSLGLDLRGGTRLVLAPVGDVPPDIDLDEALDGARDVVERRVNEFGVAESEVNRLGNNRLQVQLPGIDPEEAIDKIGRTALLQFCEPVQDEAGNVATTTGTVSYQPLTCEPQRDPEGNIVITGGEIEFLPWIANSANNPPTQAIVWQPATAVVEEGGDPIELTGRLLRPTTFVTPDPITGQPILQFEWTNDGRDVSEEITGRLSERALPFAPFLDGEPVLDSNGLPIAPRVQATIREVGTITGLDLGEAQDLSRLLNTGAFPIPLEVVSQQDVDSTLGDQAVRNSVIAGEIALLLIMAFMILYYRLPGLMASLALVVYTSFVLAIFKVWPVTLTLAGVGAFILSVGMAVDANILIFERMKEELRVGRNIVVALEDGFSRAWSSIRDSNISTLITCVILYWFGDQFGESSIKGFAITLAIGVLVSMFSAITVTRTFMHLIVSYRPIARRLWLFAPDLTGTGAQEARPEPAIAGGADGEERRS